jgi:hypothetical protein
MRFLTVLRLTLHLLPFGPYFVPVALMGFYPSELFPLKEPVTSRCHSPLAITSPASNRLSGNKLADAQWCPLSNHPIAEGLRRRSQTGIRGLMVIQPGLSLPSALCPTSQPWQQNSGLRHKAATLVPTEDGY